MILEVITPTQINLWGAPASVATVFLTPLDQHMEECSKSLIPCPNACGKDKILQDEIDSHKDECRLEMVWCEYYDVGCKTTLVREEMPAHYRDAMGEHLQFMHNVVRKLEQENLGNAEQIKQLLNNQALQEEAKIKMREDMAGINEQCRKDMAGINKHYSEIKSNVNRRSLILVGGLALTFGVIVFHYENRLNKLFTAIKHCYNYLLNL